MSRVAREDTMQHWMLRVTDRLRMLERRRAPVTTSLPAVMLAVADTSVLPDTATPGSRWWVRDERAYYQAGDDGTVVRA